MSGQPSGSSTPARPTTPSSSSHPKAIGSLAKKQSDVTRQGTQKLKFVPILPARRKKEGAAPSEPPGTPKPDRGRGSNRGRGRGEGTRGAAPPHGAVQEMTASGPFALGPTAMSNTSNRRIEQRSNYTTPVAPGSTPAAGLSHAIIPILKVDKGKSKAESRNADEGDERESYSDADEGVEIIDMEDVKGMDWMAPESLPKVKNEGKKAKERRLAKKGSNKSYSLKGKEPAHAPEDEIDLENALDLSESDQEEDLEDLIEDFAQIAAQEIPDIRQERLYFFQFPSPFPAFVAKASAASAPESMAVDTQNIVLGTPKRVSFAADVKPGSGPSSSRASAAPETAVREDLKPDGAIGRLEVYRSGRVKMLLGDGIVLDVVAATQPSFLQHAVHLDLPSKRLCVLGEVNKQFVVSPNIECLLGAMDRSPPGE